jgi:hypothetical protein
MCHARILRLSGRCGGKVPVYCDVGACFDDECDRLSGQLNLDRLGLLYFERNIN